MPTPSYTKPPPGNATLDSWLQAAAVEAQMKRATELLAQIPAKVAAQLEDHWRELTTRNIELGTELRAKTQQLSAAAAKLKRMEAAMHKLRMDVAAVLEKTFEPREEHKALLEQVVGKGYGATESGKRLLRMHAADIVEHIKQKGGDDILRHMELARAVHERLSAGPKSAHDDEIAVKDTIILGIREWIAALKKKYAGRFPNEVRAGYLAVLQAAGKKCTYRHGPATATAVGRMLGMSLSMRAHACTHAPTHTHARMHARMHARTHARI